MQHNYQVIELFENLISDFTGAPYAVAVDCCTNALFLSLKYNSKSHDCVEIPRKTYISVPMMAIHNGFKIKFIDTEWKGMYKMNPTNVIDAAGRFMRDMYIPGSLQCISFGSKKILSTGKGGMILTDDKHANDWLKKVRFAGRPGPFYNQMNDVDVLGYHMQMIPEQASRGIEAFHGLQHPCDDKCRSETYMDISGFSVFSDYIL